MMASIIADILDIEWAHAEKNIRKRINKLTKSKHDRKWLLEYAKGSLLIKHPEVQDFEIFEHYFIHENHCNIYIIDFLDENTSFGFIIDGNDWVRYGSFKTCNFQEYLCVESLIVPRTIKDVLEEFDVPDAEDIPLLYQPK